MEVMERYRKKFKTESDVKSDEAYSKALKALADIKFKESVIKDVVREFRLKNPLNETSNGFFVENE